MPATSLRALTVISCFFPALGLVVMIRPSVARATSSMKTDDSDNEEVNPRQSFSASFMSFAFGNARGATDYFDATRSNIDMIPQIKQDVKLILDKLGGGNLVLYTDTPSHIGLREALKQVRALAHMLNARCTESVFALRQAFSEAKFSVDSTSGGKGQG